MGAGEGGCLLDDAQANGAVQVEPQVAQNGLNLPREAGLLIVVAARLFLPRAVVADFGALCFPFSRGSPAARKSCPDVGNAYALAIGAGTWEEYIMSSYTTFFLLLPVAPAPNKDPEMIEDRADCWVLVGWLDVIEGVG